MNKKIQKYKYYITIQSPRKLPSSLIDSHGTYFKSEKATQSRHIIILSE